MQWFVSVPEGGFVIIVLVERKEVPDTCGGLALDEESSLLNIIVMKKEMEKKLHFGALVSPRIL